MKHAILLQLLSRRPHGEAFAVLDTHAGAGVYDLDDGEAQRSGEAAGGVGRLMGDPDAPGAFTPLIAAVRNANPDGRLRWYPGSPRLIIDALGRGDSYLGCDLHPQVQARLSTAIMARRPGAPHALAKLGDGYDEALRFLATDRPGLILVDPPFERDDDHRRSREVLCRAASRGRVMAVVWTPVKDLETFDAFLRGIEAAGVRATVAQVRVRPPTDPTRLNGCALTIVGGPDLTDDLRAICDWSAGAFGAPGGAGRVFHI